MAIRVLIADPNEALLATYQEYLVRKGFTVTAATDAQQCLDQLSGFRPDVLVLDADLPWGGSDGVLALMREDYALPTVPVLVLATGDNLDTLYRVFEFQVDDFELKPVQPHRLVRRIVQLIESPTDAGQISTSNIGNWPLRTYGDPGAENRHATSRHCETS